jgi:hypothetical protein
VRNTTASKLALTFPIPQLQEPQLRLVEVAHRKGARCCLRGLRREVRHCLDRGPLRPGRLGGVDPPHPDHQDPGSSLASSRSREAILIPHHPVQIVGDDLTVTNPLRIKTAIEKKACNGLLLKVNQIGTITESIRATQLAQSDGWGVMVSHRSGETEECVAFNLNTPAAFCADTPPLPLSLFFSQHDHCRPCCRPRCRRDQDWCSLPFRACCQVCVTACLPSL